RHVVSTGRRVTSTRSAADPARCRAPASTHRQPETFNSDLSGRKRHIGAFPRRRLLAQDMEIRMLDNLKIGSRLSLGFGLVMALLCLMAGVAAWQMQRLDGNTDYYSENLIPSFEAQHQITLALSDLRRYEYQHVLADSPADMDAAEA